MIICDSNSNSNFNYLEASSYAIAQILRTDEKEVYDDVLTILTITSNGRSVCYLATYYVFRLSKSKIQREISSPRVIYIMAYGLALKYLNDCKCIRVSDWEIFAQIRPHGFWEIERILLRHLNYKMDPGFEFLKAMFAKIHWMWKRRFEQYQNKSKVHASPVDRIIRPEPRDQKPLAPIVECILPRLI
jgi:hypothetical protein